MTKMIQVTLYDFEELGEKAQNKVLGDVTEFLLNYMGDCDEVKSAINKAERQRTPWFTQQILFDDSKEFVMAEAKRVWYNEDGSFGAVKDEDEL